MSRHRRPSKAAFALCAALAVLVLAGCSNLGVKGTTIPVPEGWTGKQDIYFRQDVYSHAASRDEVLTSEDRLLDAFKDGRGEASKGWLSAWAGLIRSGESLAKDKHRGTRIEYAFGSAASELAIGRADDADPGFWLAPEKGVKISATETASNLISNHFPGVGVAIARPVSPPLQTPPTSPLPPESKPPRPIPPPAVVRIPRPAPSPPAPNPIPAPAPEPPASVDPILNQKGFLYKRDSEGNGHPVILLPPTFAPSTPDSRDQVVEVRAEAQAWSRRAVYAGLHNPVSINGVDYLRPHYRLSDTPPSGPGLVRVIRGGTLYLFGLQDMGRGRIEDLRSVQIGK